MARTAPPSKTTAKGKPVKSCRECGSNDIGWCDKHGGWWCACGANAEDIKKGHVNE